ncbi:MAG: translation initiation factor IF-2 subunit gamma, partial [Sulfolobales archaeon]
LMATVLSGAALMDGAILVISATDPCPQPQTREHLIAVKLIGVRNIVVVQNKVDAVSKERALKNYEEIRRFLEEMGYRDLPVIPVSALHKINIDALLMHIQKYIPTPERDVRAKPLFLIARSFDVNRPGTPYEKLVGGVIGGSVVRGVFRVGDEIEIKPGIEIRESSGKTYYKPLQTRIASIRFGNEEFTEARPGGLAAFGTKLDPFYTKADKLVGGFVSLAGELPEPEYEFTIRYSLLERVVGVKEMLKMTPLKTRERILISIGTLTTFATINRISDEIMELTSQKPVIALKDFSVAISRQIAGRWRIAGYGKIV